MSPARQVVAGLGSAGVEVVALQRRLNALGAELIVDGLFGPRTEEAVASFQALVGLYADGIVGPLTIEALYWAAQDARHAAKQQPQSTRLPIVRVLADKHRDGYSAFRLRSDVAEAYLEVRDVVTSAGGVLTSSGGLRSLTASVSGNRSATSLHYTGRALDLFVYSAKVDPYTDPYVVVPDPEVERAWIVYVRVEHGEEMELDGMTWERKLVRTSGTFLNLTKLFAAHGFQRIRARPSFFGSRRVNMASEWWHFQYEGGLTVGESTFGDELLQIYSLDEVIGSPPWAYRKHIWGENWH